MVATCSQLITAAGEGVRGTQPSLGAPAAFGRVLVLRTAAAHRPADGEVLCHACRDALHLGDCDDAVSELCGMLGWQDDLTALTTSTRAAAPS